MPFLKNITEHPMWVPAAVKAPKLDATNPEHVAHIMNHRQEAVDGVLDPGEEVEVKDEALADHLFEVFGKKRLAYRS